MKPTEVRRQLLDEHALLRAMMADARTLAASTAERSAALHEALAEIAEALRAHNVHEEELTEQVLPMLDGWGNTRKDVMRDEHVAEHRELYEALLVATTTPDRRLAAATANAVFDQMLAHMDREERVLLAEDVLSDEELPPDSFGG